MTKMILRTLAAFGLSATLATGAVADQRSYAHTHGGQQHGGFTNDQVAGGLLALLLLGIAIDKLDDNDNNRRNDARVRIETDHGRPSHDARAARRTLPSECLRRFNTHDGPRRVVMERCLERNYRYTHRLPRQCEVRVRTNRGVRDAYGARCLRRNGFNFNG